MSDYCYWEFDYDYGVYESTCGCGFRVEADICPHCGRPVVILGEVSQ